MATPALGPIVNPDDLNAQPQVQQSNATPLPPAPAPQNQPSRPPTGLKGLLSNMFSGMAEAGMHYAGMQTDQQKAQQQFQNALQVQQAQSLDGFRRAQEQANAPVPLIGVDGKPITGADGTVITLPGNHAATWYAAQQQAAARQNVAQINANPKLAALGLNPDGSPMDESQLSPIQKQRMSQVQALTDVANAKAELDRASNDPNSPLFKQKVQEFQAKMAALQSSLGLRAAMVGLATQKNNALYGGGVDDQTMQRLTPAAQGVLQQSEPTHEQVKQLLATFAPMKDDNTPGKFLGQRAEYSLGIQSDIGQASDAIAQLELNKVAGAARVMKGASRSYQALQMAMTHLPNVWIDSPKMIYSKLSNLDAALEQIKQDAFRYGQKSGLTPNVPTQGNMGTAGAPQGGGMIFARDPQGKLHQAPAGTKLPQGWTLGQ